MRVCVSAPPTLQANVRAHKFCEQIGNSLKLRNRRIKRWDHTIIITDKKNTYKMKTALKVSDPGCYDCDRLYNYEPFYVYVYACASASFELTNVQPFVRARNGLLSHLRVLLAVAGALTTRLYSHLYATRVALLSA